LIAVFILTVSKECDLIQSAKVLSGHVIIDLSAKMRMSSANNIIVIIPDFRYRMAKRHFGY
jgi:hypothetical protein